MQLTANTANTIPHLIVASGALARSLYAWLLGTGAFCLKAFPYGSHSCLAWRYSLYSMFGAAAEGARSQPQTVLHLWGCLPSFWQRVSWLFGIQWKVLRRRALGAHSWRAFGLSLNGGCAGFFFVGMVIGVFCVFFVAFLEPLSGCPMGERLALH